jgi:seryl-tRNA synthetase
MEQAKNLRKAIANAIGSKSKKDAKDPNQSSLEKSKASLKGALLGKKKAQEAKATAAEGFFSLYANLLSEDARFCWDKIVVSQVRAAPWTDLQGNDLEEECDKSMESFQD